MGGNFFYGSLEHLKDLKKLKQLDISDNDIDSGLEHLPNNIEEFYCYVFTNSQAGVGTIYEELKPFAIDAKKGKYDWERLKKKSNNKKIEKEIREMHIDRPFFEKLEKSGGELDLEKLEELVPNYSIKTLYICPDIDEKKLVIKNQKEDVKIIKLVNAQKHIDKYYPIKEDRKRITELDLQNQNNDKNLVGDLDLSDFINLKSLYCGGNKLTSLKISNCYQLKEIYCANNQLKECWQDISPYFDYSDRLGWERVGFDKEKTKKWIEVGALPSDYSLVNWLKNNNKGTEWILNNKLEFTKLQARHTFFG